MTTLNECPPGLFLFDGCLGVKSEYKTESAAQPGVWQCDAYVVASGEYFWGGISNAIDRGNLMVQPVDYGAALTALEAAGLLPLITASRTGEEG